jgi:hypothetical protein
VDFDTQKLVTDKAFSVYKSPNLNRSSS